MKMNLDIEIIFNNLRFKKKLWNYSAIGFWLKCA